MHNALKLICLIPDICRNEAASLLEVRTLHAIYTYELLCLRGAQPAVRRRHAERRDRVGLPGPVRLLGGCARPAHLLAPCVLVLPGARGGVGRLSARLSIALCFLAAPSPERPCRRRGIEPTAVLRACSPPAH